MMLLAVAFVVAVLSVLLYVVKLKSR